MILDNDIETEFPSLGKDKDGNRFEKNARIIISNHPNKELDGNNYMVLRRWEMGNNEFECIREVNGVVQHIVADSRNIKKVK